MSGFMAGFGTGVFGGLAQQQQAAREQNAQKRTMFLQHYLNNVVPQYYKTKAQSVRLKGMVNELAGMGFDEAVARKAVQVSGGDYEKAIEFINSQRPTAVSGMNEQLTDIGLAQQTPEAEMPTQTQQAETVAQAGSAAPAAAPLPQQNEVSGVTGFWNSVVLREESDQAIQSEVANEVGALFGVDGATVANWMEVAYADPMVLAGVSGGPGVTLDSAYASRREEVRDYLAPSFIENVEGDVKEYARLLRDYEENGNQESMDAAMEMILSFEDKAQIKATHTASQPRSVNPEVRTMMNAIANRFGEFTVDNQGQVVLTSLEADLQTDIIEVFAVGESFIKNGLGSNEAAKQAMRLYDAGKIEGTSKFKGVSDAADKNLPEPKTREERDALAPGTRYRDPNGEIKVKK